MSQLRDRSESPKCGSLLVERSQLGGEDDGRVRLDMDDIVFEVIRSREHSTTEGAKGTVCDVE